ncbi:hypothetical protein CEXT_101781 [Caerostris extrusa]|uniref:Uncharacterized protein n=1 Tax=Caerostris extrusa TaxID=172846 RepID=A0AAV4P5H1_CAEEX|nr:hypothetical protein CEXT_101781 [Caerostris extrusa]
MSPRPLFMPFYVIGDEHTPTNFCAVCLWGDGAESRRLVPLSPSKTCPLQKESANSLRGKCLPSHSLYRSISSVVSTHRHTSALCVSGGDGAQSRRLFVEIVKTV